MAVAHWAIRSQPQLLKLGPRAARDHVETKECGCQDHLRTDSFYFAVCPGCTSPILCQQQLEKKVLLNFTEVQLGRAHLFSQIANCSHAT